MASRLLRIFSGEVRGLHQAAYLLGFFALLSQVLALLRDRIFAAFFGAGETLDIYYAAFRIPDLLFVGVASLLSVYVLIPFVTERLEDRDELRRFMGSMLSALSIFLALGSILVFIAAPGLVRMFFPGYTGETFASVVLLTRILLIQAFLLGVSNLFSSVTQTFRRFVITATTPLLYNIGIIAGALLFYPVLGLPGLAWGAVLGAAMHFMLQVPFLIQERLWPRFALPRADELRRVFAISVPRTISLTANNIALLAYAAFSSLLPVGSLAIFTLAYNLQSAPVTVIGLSYSVAAFPTLAALFSSNAREAFLREVSIAARHIIFWTIPALAILVVLRAHIVRVILGAGAFDWTDTRLTAAALALFALSLPAHGLILLLVRAYYAAGNTKTPLIATMLGVPVGILSAYGFLKLFAANPGFQAMIESLLRVEGLPGTSALMLPLGYTVGILVQALLLIALFEKDFRGFIASVRGVALTSTISAVFGGVSTYASLQLLGPYFSINTFYGVFMQGALAGVLGIVVMIGVLRALKSPELDETWRSLHTKFWRAKAIVPGDES